MSWYERRTRQELQAYNILARDAEKIDADRAIRELRVAGKTGLPGPVIRDRLEDIEREVAKADFNLERFRAESPIVWDYYKANPAFRSLGLEEALKAGAAERLLTTPPELWPIPETQLREAGARRVEATIRIHEQARQLRAQRLGVPIEDVPQFGLATREQRQERIQRHVQERLAEERFIAGTDRVGFFERLGLEGVRIPFLTSLLSDAPRMVALYQAAKAVEAGTADDQQRDDVLRFARMNAAHVRRGGDDFGGKVAGILAQLPEFVGEFAATSGVYSMVRGVVIKGGKEAAESVLRGAVNRVLRGRLSAFVAGSAAQAAVSGAVRIPLGTLERLTPIFAAEVAPAEGLRAILTEKGADFLPALAKAGASHFVEILSERTGLLAENLVHPLKVAIVHRWLKINPYATVAQALAKIRTATGWNGMVGEVFEERVAGFGQGVIEGDPVGRALFRQVPALLGGGLAAEDLLAEAAAFAVPGALGGSAGLIQARLRRRATAGAGPEYFGRLADVAQAMQLSSQAPEAAQELVGGMVKSRPNDVPAHIYIPIQAWNEYWQTPEGAGAREARGEAAPAPGAALERRQEPARDPREAFGEIVGDARAYDEAARTGADLQIPTEKYIARISANPARATYFQRHSRTDPADVLPGDVDVAVAGEPIAFPEGLRRGAAPEAPATPPTEAASAAEPGAVAVATTPHPQQKLFETIRDELLELNIQAQQLEGLRGQLRPRDVAFQASLVVERFAARAQILGVDPFELYRAEGLTFGVETGEPMKGGRVLEQPGGGDKFVTAAGELSGSQEERDLAEELLRVGARVTKDGNVRLFHRTTTDAAERIRQTGRMTGKEDGLFFSTSQTGQAEGFGTAVVEFSIPLGRLQLDDVLADEAHLRVPLRRPGAFINVKPWLTGTSEFRQPGEGDKPPRGRTRIGPFGINVDLLRTANLSTFFHEMGHVWLEEIGRDVMALSLRDRATLTPEQVRFVQDADAVLGFLGVDSFGAIRPKVEHEKWARAVEAYVMEGKAPSATLRRAFEQFRRWLLSVYKALTGIGAELTPRIREVMDRLLAGQEEIDAARAADSIEPLVVDPGAVGWSEAKAREYEEVVGEARAEAEQAMSGRLLEKIERRKAKEWQQEREGVREDVARELSSDPGFVALAVLTTGKRPDGSEPNLPTWKGDAVSPVGYKLSRAAVVAEYGEGVADSLPRAVFAPKDEDGVSPDHAAPEFGFLGGGELVQALAAVLTAERGASPVAAIEQQLQRQLSDLEQKAESIGKRAAVVRGEITRALTQTQQADAKKIERALREQAGAGIAEIREALKEIRSRGGIRPTSKGQGDEVLPPGYMAAPGKGIASDEFAQELFDRGLLGDATGESLYAWIGGLFKGLATFEAAKKRIPFEARRIARQEARSTVKELVANVQRQIKLKGQLQAVRKEARLLQRSMEVKADIGSIMDRLADQRMDERHPDVETERELRDEADRALHAGPARVKMLHMELVALVAKGGGGAFRGLLRTVAGRARPGLRSIEEFRRDATTEIAAKKLRDIRPALYKAAEAKHAKEALGAFGRGDFDAAMEAKERQLWNHVLFQAAEKARRDEAQGIRYVRRSHASGFQEMLGKAGADYVQRWQEIEEQYEFRRVSGRKLEKRASLREWLQREEAKTGLRPSVPDHIIDDARAVNYRELSHSDFVEVLELLKGIEHQARLKTRLLAAKRTREFKTAVSELRDSIARFFDIKAKPVDLTKVYRDKFRLLRQVKASMIRPEFFFEMLDGDRPNGPAWNYLFRPFAEAEDVKNGEETRVAKEMARLFGRFSRQERASWWPQFLRANTLDAPELANTKTNGKLVFAQVLAIALNQGNIYNRQALLEGYGWTQAQVDAVLGRHMEKRHWELVQGVWGLIDTLRPASFELQRALTGRIPERVEPEPFTIATKDGETASLAGGYYPIVFSAELSIRQGELNEQETIRDMFGGTFGQAQTQHGHLINRTNTGGKALSLELLDFTNHLSAVIHDTATRKALIDVWRLVHDPVVRDAIIAAAGKEAYETLKPWLRHIARDRQMSLAHPLEKLVGRIRRGATIVHLGLNVTSGLLQALGLGRTLAELGPTYMAKGLQEFSLGPDGAGPWQAWEFVTARSQAMRDRLGNYDRDIREYAKKLGVIPRMDQAFFTHIGMMDLMVSIPTWLGAYHKALDGRVKGVPQANEEEAVAFADRTVRVSQAAGAAKDLAGVQRGSETWKIWIMFYSEMSIQFNQFAKMSRMGPRLIREGRYGEAAAYLLGATMGLWFVPAVLEELIRGYGPDDDEEWIGWAATNVAGYPLQSVPLVRDVAFAFERGIQPRGTPLATVMQGAVGAARAGQRLAQGEDVSTGAVRGAVIAGSYFTPLPTSQLWKTSDYFYAWATGEEEPDNPLEGAWRALITGRPRR